jgi:hypothetical protein
MPCAGFSGHILAQTVYKAFPMKIIFRYACIVVDFLHMVSLPVAFLRKPANYKQGGPNFAPKKTIKF